MRPGSKARNFARALISGTLDFEFELIPYRLESVSSKKLMTLFRSELNCMRSRPRTPWYPVQLQIEPSAACTLHCPLCPIGTDAVDPRRSMSMEMFRDLIDEVGDFAVIAVLWMWGEPFINQRLPEMIAYARSRNIATVTSTNGQHIQSREEAESLVGSGLDCLTVALDGSTQDVYSQYRIGGDISKVFRCLELVRQAKDSLGSEKPLVNLRTVVMKHNEHQLGEIAQIARKYGADFVSRKTVCTDECRNADVDRQFAPDNPLYRRYDYKDGKRIRRPVDAFGCRRPWNRMTVSSDGTVVSCEFDSGTTAPFGRGGKTNSFLDLWRTGASEAFRRQFLLDRSVYKFCVECHYRDRREDDCTVEAIRQK